eukprot:4328004-Pyramimonas_sp.AAC.1
MNPPPPSEHRRWRGARDTTDPRCCVRDAIVSYVRRRSFGRRITPTRGSFRMDVTERVTH